MKTGVAELTGVSLFQWPRSYSSVNVLTTGFIEIIAAGSLTDLMCRKFPRLNLSTERIAAAGADSLQRTSNECKYRQNMSFCSATDLLFAY